MWDIYGNHLKPGHCEVHPHVAQSYPCSTCNAEQIERERVSAMQQGAYNHREMNIIEKIEHIRNVLGMFADQQTVNMAGEVQEEIERLLNTTK